VPLRFEADLRFEWGAGGLVALIKEHADVLRAIGLAPTRDASRWCLPLRGLARCPLDARHPIIIIVSIRAVRVPHLIGLVLIVFIALLP
jgi:hypothetical protein